MIREARVDDIPVMRSIRDNVRENPLTSGVIDHDAYARAITVDGKAWVFTAGGEVVGFVCGRLAQADIWGLFVRASHEGLGIGNALMAVVEDWMFASGVRRIVLSTDPGTRAERLYRRRGWSCEGTTDNGELRFALSR